MTATLDPVPSTLPALTGKYFTFALGHESYGIPARKVKEIIRLVKITPLPQTPEYLKGVINLRGKVIPVIDLRIKFGLNGTETTDHTCLVVFHLDRPDGSFHPTGMIVDAVEGIIPVEHADIMKPSSSGARAAPDCQLGMVRIKGAAKILLDIEKAVGDEFIQLLDSSS